MPVYSYDPPERFIAGTVGQPGERTFYLQASAAGRVTSVSLEKVQVSLLAERLDELLDEVLRRRRQRPGASPSAPADDGPLDVPLLEDFRVGAIALAWDRDEERVVIEAQEETEAPVEPLTEDVPEDGPGVLRVRITAAMARAFSQRAHADRQRGPAALPAVRAAAGRERAHLPAAERTPGQPCLIGPRADVAGAASLRTAASGRQPSGRQPARRQAAPRGARPTARTAAPRHRARTLRQRRSRRPAR